ncbi:DUF6458 family protein [Kribbella swartbergensis]
MSIGAGIFLITAGAILAFGIRDRSGAVDLNVVGVVVMLAGAAGIWLSYYITNKRQRVRTEALDPVVEEEYRSVQDTAAEHSTLGPSAASTAPRSTAGVDGDLRPAAPDPEPRPVAATPERPAVVDQSADTATERHVDLDPAASGLHTPTPDRTPPAAAPTPPMPPEPRHTWSSRLRNRFKTRH